MEAIITKIKQRDSFVAAISGPVGSGRHLYLLEILNQSLLNSHTVLDNLTELLNEQVTINWWSTHQVLLDQAHSLVKQKVKRSQHKFFNFSRFTLNNFLEELAQQRPNQVHFIDESCFVGWTNGLAGKAKAYAIFHKAISKYPGMIIVESLNPNLAVNHFCNIQINFQGNQFVVTKS